LSTLNKISSTDIGKEVVGELSSSKNDFNFTNTYATDNKGNVITSALDFEKAKGGGGEIHAGELMNPDIKEEQKLESSAHELFHGYQYETGQNPGTVNGEVGASLFGKAIVNQVIGMTSAFGKLSTTVGRFYDNTMNAMMWDKKGFNYILYNQATYNFIKGSVMNYKGDYDKFKIQRNDVDPAIKKFFPLVR
jgi:hypothetical protein